MSTPVIVHPPGSSGPPADVGRLLLGVLVVAVGGVFLLDGLGVLDAGTTIGDWWPSAIVALGALQLLERPRPLLSATLLMAAGGALLLFTTGTVERSAWDVVWPAAIVAAGVALLLRRRGSGASAVEHGDDTLVATGIFGGPSVASTSPAFRRASLTAIFGGVTLDLRRATPAPDGATVTATAAFGGVEVLVPRGWRITTRTTPIFGGVDDKTDPEAPVPPDAPLLHVDALAVFGGVDIKHEKD
jgi:hypothetical protein